MKNLFADKTCAALNSRRVEAGSTRTVILILVSFFLGVAVTAFWFRHGPTGNAGTAVSGPVTETTAPAPAPEAVGIPAPAPAPVTAPPAMPRPTDPAIIDEVKKAIPNFASISLADGEQILREAALKEFADATAETDDQIRAAQQQLQNAQNKGSAADQQAAMKRVQDTQAAATEKLRAIAANLQNQITALKSLKNQQ